MEETEGVEWFKFFEWSDNPFKIRPDPGNMVGFIDMRTRMLTYMNSEDAFIVTGTTGAGKTTLLRWIEEQKNNALYFNFLDDIKERHFKKKVEGGFLEKLFRLFSDSKKTVLIDEAQEMSPELMKWLRGKYDSGKVSSIVLASIREELHNLEEPFVDRIGGRIVTVRSLTEEEAFKMVKQRIFSKGKSNPFTEEALGMIFARSGCSPRKILENCEACCIYALRNNVKYIGQGVVKEALGGFKAPEAPVKKEAGTSADIRNLSPSQRKIIKILSEEELTTKQIAERLDVSRASVAKQLSRLSFKTDKKLLQSKGFNSPLVEPKNMGRPVVYGLNEEAGKILVQAPNF